MASELQQIVDSLALRLQRSVALDDLQMRLQVYSPHYGPVDEARLESILQRQASAETIRWVRSQGITKAVGPLHVPGSEEFKMMSRLCAPVIHQGERLGYLWLIDSVEDIREDELELVVQAAQEVAAVMYRERVLRRMERSHEREMVGDLLSEDPTRAVSAAQRLVEQEMVTPGHVMTLVLRPVSGMTTGDEECRLAIDTALTQIRQAMPPRRALHLARSDHGVLIVSVPNKRGSADEPIEIGRRLHEGFMALRSVGSTARVVVGVGGVQSSHADAAISYRQATQAARVAEVMPSVGDVVGWEELGVYRLLIQLPPEELTAEALPPELHRILGDEFNDVLIETLECFLDLAGSVKETAAALNIHRTTLYYRLSRAEELAGVDLGSGADRLVVHLGIKIAHLTGLIPPPRVLHTRG